MVGAAQSSGRSNLFAGKTYKLQRYQLSDLPLDQLPSGIKATAEHIMLLLPMIATSQEGFIYVQHKCKQRTLALMMKIRELICDKRREAQVTRLGKRQSTADWLKHAQSDQKIQEIVNTLAPEWQSLLHRSVDLCDALVWLEMDGTTMSIREQRQHRDQVVKHIVDWANLSLRFLGNFVVDPNPVSEMSSIKSIQRAHEEEKKLNSIALREAKLAEAKAPQASVNEELGEEDSAYEVQVEIVVELLIPEQFCM